jgi:hypothetical protein
MAGSYKHVVTDDGNLGSNEFVVDMLENGGDVFEAVEEMYGMIWYLTGYLVEEKETLPLYNNAMKAVVEEARQHYREGLAIAQAVNQEGGE